MNDPTPVPSEEKIPLGGTEYLIRKSVTPSGDPIYVLYRHTWCSLFGSTAMKELARNRSKVVLEDAKRFLETP